MEFIHHGPQAFDDFSTPQSKLCTANVKESYTVLKYILSSGLARDVLEEISGIPSLPTIVCG